MMNINMDLFERFRIILVKGLIVTQEHELTLMQFLITKNRQKRPITRKVKRVKVYSSFNNNI